MRGWILALALAGIAGADTIACKDGRKLEGKIVEETEGSVKLQVKHGSVTIPRHHIKEIIRGATTAEVYQDRSSRLSPTDVKGLLELAKWCEEQKLRDEARAEYERVVAADPENALARAALGHVRHEGAWMTFEEAARARGLVEFEGQWMSPEQARVKAALKEEKELEQALADSVRDSLRKLASSDAEVRSQARAKLDSIPGDYKYWPLLEHVESRTPEVRAYCVGALSTYNRPEALPRIARRVLVDEAEGIREAALEALRAWKNPETWMHLQKGLQSDASSVRIRAANALAEFPNEGAAESLIGMLSRANQPRGGFSVERRDPDGGLAGDPKLTPEARKALEDAGKLPSGGLTPKDNEDDTKRKEAAEKEIAAAVRALEACTGLSYGNNVDAWRDWWLKKHAASAAGGGTPGPEREPAK